LDAESNDLEALRTLVRQLAQRVDVLERKLDSQAQLSERPASVPPVVSAQAESSRSAIPGSAIHGSAIPPQPVISAAAHTTPVPPHAPVILPQTAAPVRGAKDQDLESRIGSHWLNRIGITAVLIGVSYFL
jgi:uncharacterized membrane protein